MDTAEHSAGDDRHRQLLRRARGVRPCGAAVPAWRAAGEGRGDVLQGAAVRGARPHRRRAQHRLGSLPPAGAGRSRPSSSPPSPGPSPILFQPSSPHPPCPAPPLPPLPSSSPSPPFSSSPPFPQTHERTSGFLLLFLCSTSVFSPSLLLSPLSVLLQSCFSSFSSSPSLSFCFSSPFSVPSPFPPSGPALARPSHDLARNRGD